MRVALTIVGIGFLILGIGAYFLTDRIAPTSDTIEQHVSSSSKRSMAAPPLSITSSEFETGASIPSRFTCDGDRLLSPALSISGVPESAVSLALIMDDPDVPKVRVPSGVVDHWVLYNIPPATSAIPEGGTAGIAGVNTRGEKTYMGPCPPPEYEPSEHRYFFKLYALDTMLALQEGATKAQVEEAMQGHILAQGELMGRYKRK